MTNRRQPFILNLLRIHTFLDQSSDWLYLLVLVHICNQMAIYDRNVSHLAVCVAFTSFLPVAYQDTQRSLDLGSAIFVKN